MDESHRSADVTYSPERLIALSDGVFAIAITLLVLELRLPEMSQSVSATVFNAALLELTPRFLSYMLSFIVIGLYQHGHVVLVNGVGWADSG